jgi:hypothetical protein
MIRGTEKYDEPKRSMYLDVVADSLLMDLLRVKDALGDDAVAVEQSILQWHVFGPIWERDYPDCYDRADALKAMRYDEYMRSPEWAEQRKRALARACYRCQGCNAEDNLEVHHRFYGDRGDEDLRDLTVLCAGCHTAVHLVADGRRGKVRNESRRARV